MFNDKYGLTGAVLNGSKTMTRRNIPELDGIEDPDISEWGIDDKGKAYVCLYVDGKPSIDIYPKYQPGEIVAIAQPYKDITDNKFFINQCAANEETVSGMKYEKGWNNKMFVASYYMPHHIEITNIKIERLQDISYEDCIREGVIKNGGWEPYNFALRGFTEWFETPRNAFAALIDKVSGKGTWEKNPYVFVYSFKLINPN